MEMDLNTYVNTYISMRMCMYVGAHSSLISCPCRKAYAEWKGYPSKKIVEQFCGVAMHSAKALRFGIETTCHDIIYGQD